MPTTTTVSGSRVLLVDKVVRRLRCAQGGSSTPADHGTCLAAHLRSAGALADVRLAM